jgi:hypothetical protein
MFLKRRMKVNQSNLVGTWRRKQTHSAFRTRRARRLMYLHPPRRFGCIVRLGWSDHFLIFYKEKTPVALCTRTSWEGVYSLESAS